MLRLLFLVIFLSGCQTAQTVTTRTPLYKYRADLRITADGRTHEGLMSIARSVPTKIQVDSPVKMDLLRISTCNRDVTVEKVGNRGGWWSESGTQYIYDYIPTAVESEGFCPMYIQVFDGNLLTSWSMVSFKTTEKLKADVSCNGENYPSVGIDSCQSMYGFEQGLAFAAPIKYTSRGPCAVRKLDEQTLRIRTTGPGFCGVTVYDGKDFFKFILLGYDEILVRGKAQPIKTDFGGGGW